MVFDVVRCCALLQFIYIVLLLSVLRVFLLNRISYIQEICSHSIRPDAIPDGIRPKLFPCTRKVQQYALVHPSLHNVGVHDVKVPTVDKNTLWYFLSVFLHETSDISAHMVYGVRCCGVAIIERCFVL